MEKSIKQKDINSTIMYEMQELKEYLESNFKISNLKELSQNSDSKVAGTGTTKSTILFGDTKGGQKVVIKIGVSNSTSGVEIIKNYEAYEVSKKIGANIIPKIVLFDKYKNLNLLIIEHGATDFVSLMRGLEKDKNGLQNAYQGFIEKLNEVHRSTQIEDAQQVMNFVNYTFERLAENFEKYLIPAGLAEADNIKLIRLIQQEIKVLLPTKVEWTNWGEFVPEHVFISNGRYFVIDPKGKDQVLAIPQIDLAIFAELCRVYSLPGAEDNYYKFKELSLEITSSQGGNSEIDSIWWALGHALQYSMSSRFRLDKHPKESVEYAKKSIKNIEKLRDYVMEAKFKHNPLNNLKRT